MDDQNGIDKRMTMRGKRLNWIIAGMLIVLINQVSIAQFDPMIGLPGSKGMHKDSSAFKSWANECEVVRGWKNIADTTLGKVGAGDSSMALGKADGVQVVSLGDGGMATLRFPQPISDGPGPDFAVFENSFDGRFLELAFVEVSTDGIQFERFNAVSNSDTAVQLHDTIKAGQINNLAGKYVGGYGTPFDLIQLKNIPGLNIKLIRFVRVIDVVGTINPLFATRDMHGNKINDPYPTAFDTGGFDLDGVGVIYTVMMGLDDDKLRNTPPALFPNPAERGSLITVSGKVKVFDLQGKLLGRFDRQINTAEFMPGMYIVEGSQGFNRLIIR